jgi:hypothetical protein
MPATITKLGILPHQICYRVVVNDTQGVLPTQEKTFKTLAAAKKWAAKVCPEWAVAHHPKATTTTEERRNGYYRDECF